MRDQLIGKIQERWGATKEAAEKQMENSLDLIKRAVEDIRGRAQQAVRDITFLSAGRRGERPRFCLRDRAKITILPALSTQPRTLGIGRA